MSRPSDSYVADPPRSSRFVVAALLVLAIVLAFAPRVIDYRAWQDDRASYFAGDVVGSNPDAFFYLRAAREIYTGAWVAGERDRLRNHPDGFVRGDAPWLSRAIAFVARFTDGDVYWAGLWLSIATSSLFVLPLVLFAWSVGWPRADGQLRDPAVRDTP